MAKVAIGSNATFTGGQKGLTIIGDWAYAYSGIHVIASSPNLQTFLEFTTGSEILVAKVSYCGDAANSWDFFTEIYLNGVLVWNATYEDGAIGTGDQPLPLVIPPHTHFEGKLSSAGADNMAMTIAGRVYRE